MIRYYAYYSCGGYKDMYLGNDSDEKDFTYFLPLLSVWKTGAKVEYSDKLKQVEGLQLIEIVTNNNDFGFPAQAKNLFSHGGYRIIYQTLQNGDTCLCVRDVKNDAKDEENRDTPFNILITASGDKDVKRLDAFALNFLSHMNELYESFTHLFSYAPIVNGLKFSLALINELLNKSPEPEREIAHKLNRVVFLVVDSLSMSQTAFNELGLLRAQIELIADIKGKRIGTIDFNEILTPTVKFKIQENEVVTTDDDGEKQSDDVAETNLVEITTNGDSDITSSSDIISSYKTISKLEDVQLNAIKSEHNNELKSMLITIIETLSSNSSSIKDIQENISNYRMEEVFNRVLQSIEKVQNCQNCQSIVKSDSERNYDTITIPKVQLWAIGIALIVGFLLGAIIL